MNKDEKKVGRWSRFQDVYAKHLIKIDLSLILLSMIIFVCSIYFKIWIVQIVVASIPILHSLIVTGIAKKELYPYKLLRRQSLIVFLISITYAIMVSFLAIIFLSGHFFPDLMIEQNLFLVLIWGFLIAAFLCDTLFLMIFSLSSSCTRSRLCFCVALDGMNDLLRIEKRKRWKWVGKNFGWFRQGLHSYNAYIIDKMPGHPKLKNIDLYYDKAYLVALEGNAKELKDLATYIGEAHDSLGKQESDHDFHRFLISLQHIRGKTGVESESIYEISDLITTMPWSERIIGVLKNVGKILIVILTAIAAIIQIMKFFV